MARYRIGIDEAGRGALAGPVFVAAVSLGPKEKALFEALCRGRDSKKICANERERICAIAVQKAKEGSLFFAVSSSQVAHIERKNISGAANVCAYRVYRRVTGLISDGGGSLERVIIDGGLFLGTKDRQTALAAREGEDIATIVKADETFVEVSLASVIAKCSRDRYMRRLHQRYPSYGFREHKGYATERHRTALCMHGPSPAHRLTFLKKYGTM